MAAMDPDEMKQGSVRPSRKFMGIEVAEWVPYGSFSDVFLGHYDYGYLFLPKWPFCHGGKKVNRLPPFFAVNEPLPLLLATIMGFQHAAAMVAGIALGPLILTSGYSLKAGQGPSTEIVSYLVSVAFICSGIGTIIHVIRFKVPFTNKFYGTGVISVMGITTTQVTIGAQAIQILLDEGHSWSVGYGHYLGTIMVASFATTLVSFLPPGWLRRLFPPYIAGLTVFLVGVTLVGVGIHNWGGGFGCEGIDPTTGDQLVCTGNGSVELPYGSAEYIGLGAICFVALIFIELFGSPFMRNCEIILALLFAYFIAELVKHDGKHYTANDQINSSSNGNFLWVHTFPLGFFPGAILPFIIGFLADAATAVGDVTATEEASMVETSGPRHEERIQGCLLADGFNSFLACLATSMPINVYAQNNGIISFTLCASRVAGVAAGIWLILFGVIGKIGAIFTYAPNCVIGGITVFLFGSIAISGIKVMVDESTFSRRQRFIMVMAGGLGLGVTILPDWATAQLWNITPTMSSGVRAIRNSFILVMSTGYVFGWLVAMILENILPEEDDPKAIIRAQQRALAAKEAALNAEAQHVLSETHKEGVPV